MYKLSKYNYYIPYEDKIIYLNTLSKINFTMTHQEHSRMQKIFTDPISFSLEYPCTFRMFHNWGFFVDSEIEELSTIRYKYYEELFSSLYHIVITNFWNCKITEEFIESLKAHLNYVSQNLPIKSICIEWNGFKILDYFDKYIYPVSQYVQEICKKREIDLINQIEVQASNNEKLHERLYNNKGKATYNFTFEYLHKINSCSDFIIKLQIKALSNQETDILAFISQFSKKEKIYLVWEKYCKSNNEKTCSSKKDDLQKKISELQKKIQLNSNVWQVNTLPRVNYLNICPNGNVFMMPLKKNPLLNMEQENKKSIGQLTQYGKIEWDGERRNKILSQPWFENQICNSCKYLPLLMGTCVNYKIRHNSIICPIINDFIDFDSIAIALYKKLKRSDLMRE